MKSWTEHHQTLLNALRAQDVIPELMLRLSDEKIEATESDRRKLRDLPSALKESPAWPLIEQSLTTPRAWPKILDRIRATGLIPRADHHLFLLHLRLRSDLLEMRDYSGANRCLEQALISWQHLTHSGYLRALALDLAGPSTPVEEIISSLLNPVLEETSRWFSDLIKAPQLDATALKAAHEALLTLSRYAAPGTSESLLTLLSIPGSELRESLTHFDINNANAETMRRPFARMVELGEILSWPDALVIDTVGGAVEFAWSLRRIERDREPFFDELIELCAPANDVLFSRLNKDILVGQNSRCADFLVFQAEPLLGSRRENLLRQGLEICPGHRNSAMLLSFIAIREANELLDQVSKLPTLTKRTGEPEKILKKAGIQLKDAQDLHPFSERLQEAQARLEVEATRFEVELE